MTNWRETLTRTANQPVTETPAEKLALLLTACGVPFDRDEITEASGSLDMAGGYTFYVEDTADAGNADDAKLSLDEFYIRKHTVARPLRFTVASPRASENAYDILSALYELNDMEALVRPEADDD